MSWRAHTHTCLHTHTHVCVCTRGYLTLLTAVCDRCERLWRPSHIQKRKDCARQEVTRPLLIFVSLTVAAGTCSSHSNWFRYCKAAALWWRSWVVTESVWLSFTRCVVVAPSVGVLISVYVPEGFVLGRSRRKWIPWFSLWLRCASPLSSTSCWLSFLNESKCVCASSVWSDKGFKMKYQHLSSTLTCQSHIQLLENLWRPSGLMSFHRYWFYYT